jgi:RNA polymerase sigma-70 factor (TIGR02960 family)
LATELIGRARAGDERAFRELVDPFVRELHVHCYRLLGSVQDAEDAVQETLLAAWRGLAGYEARASLRTWLYTIATNRTLNALRSARRRPQAEPLPLDVELPAPTVVAEPLWLEPYPDVLLEEKEAISLAFVTALQLLPPRQRAVLILRDVLGYHASEVAAMLESTEESVTSALKRARATLDERLPHRDEAPPPRDSPAERALVARFVAAFEESDVEALVALLTDDVRLSMPPLPLEYRGRIDAARFLTAIFSQRRTRRVVHTRANGQPAIAVYARDAAGVFRVLGLLVVTLSGERIAAITRFDTSVIARFGLPRTL